MRVLFMVVENASNGNVMSETLFPPLFFRLSTLADQHFTARHDGHEDHSLLSLIPSDVRGFCGAPAFHSRPSSRPAFLPPPRSSWRMPTLVASRIQQPGINVLVQYNPQEGKA